ncbi:MAG: complex I NDUFA9 subunit family protein [Gammaproteobacteria bacterium]|nr:complex I NDUFA9 subunit family protein [Gammaproteobacteria bacterium]
MNITNVAILGGTGFIGRHLAARLADAGLKCRIITKKLHRYRGIQAGRGVSLVAADPFDPDQLKSAIENTQVVINLVGILNETAKNATFKKVHVELTNRVVEACGETGVNRLLHMSALNADPTNGPSTYLKTKGEGEKLVHTLGQPGIKVTSFRPSVVFGPDDSFFNRFANLLRTIPGPFPLACSHARFAPVYVGDVAAAFVHSIDDKSTWGKHYDLCGPRSFTLKELVEYTARKVGIDKRIIELNDKSSRLQAIILGKMPGRPFSMDNYLSMQVDSTCGNNGLESLGITATDIDAIVPFFLAPTAQRSRYQTLRKINRS